MVAAVKYCYESYPWLLIKLEPSISLLSLLNILLMMQFLFCNSQGLFYMPSLGPSIVRYEYAIITRTLILLMHIQRQRNA